MDTARQAPLLHGICRSFVDCREQVILFEARLSYAVLRKRNRSTLSVSSRISQTFETSFFLGWPVLKRVGDVLTYQGRLPRDCPCSQSHSPMIGTSGDSFCLSSAFPFTLPFGYVFYVPSTWVQSPLPLGLGVRSCFFGSFAYWVFSAGLYFFVGAKRGNWFHFPAVQGLVFVCFVEEPSQDSAPPGTKKQSLPVSFGY